MDRKKWLVCAVVSLLAAGTAGTAFAADGTAVSEAAESVAESGEMMFDLDAVVVTSSRGAERITDAKADISVVSREEIEQMHMQTVEEALRTVPGVQFLNYGSNGANANLSGLRINGSKDIIVLVDGVRVSDFQGAGASGYLYASLMSNMDNIEQIEVLRGAAGTIYGSGAKGGVINIITRKINETKSTLDIARGSFGKESYKFNTMGRQDRLGYHVYYNKLITGDTKDGDGNTWEGESDTKNQGIKLTYDLTDDQMLTFNYDKTKSEYSGQDIVYDTNFAGKYETDSFSLQHDYKINDKWNNRFIYRRSNIDTIYRQERDGYAVETDFTYDFLSEQANFSDGHHSIVFGLDYSKGQDNLLSIVGKDADGNRLYGKRHMKNYSYYVQDDWSITDKLTLSGGLRYDKPESDEYGQKLDSHTSTSYKLSYDITDNDSIYAGRSEFYILPSMDQLYNSKWGNRALRPVEGHTTSIGYNKQFDGNNALTINWFKTESDTTIGYDMAGQFQNYEDAVDHGWNAQFTTKLGDHWNANIGWAHLKHDADGDNYSMGYYPKNLMTFGVHYNYAKVSAGLTGFYFMRKVNPDYKHLEGWPADNYTVMNLSVNYSPTDDMTFYAKAENLFDKLYAEHTNVIHQGGQPGSWYAMPGRAFTMGMQIKF